MRTTALIPPYSADLSRWLAVPPPHHDSDENLRANWSDIWWEVYEDAGRVLVRGYSERRPKEMLNSQNSYLLPFEIGPVLFSGEGPIFRDYVTRPGTQRIARQSLIRISDGWLYLVNGGEWGGFVLWISSDGTRYYKVSDDQVHQYFRTSAGLLATEGLGHLGINEGQVIRVRRTWFGRWISEQFAPLTATPFVARLMPDSSLIVVIYDDLVRIRMNGRVETLLPSSRSCWRFTHPGSIVILPSGDIYLGMTFAVTRLRKTGNSYEPSWLIPSKSYWKTLPTEP
jgi:hypothetical protein